MPDIGDFKDVAVIEVLVKPGDTIAVEQSLITVESDKASMEIPSSAAGTLKELKVKVGDTVNIGDLIAVLEGAGGQAAGAAPQPAPEAKAPSAPAPKRRKRSAGAGLGRRPPVHRRPATTRPRRRPQACRTPLPRCASSRANSACRSKKSRVRGPKGRITQEDVQSFTKAVMSGQAATKAAAARDRPVPPAAGARRSACCRGRRSTSPSSARSSARTFRASRRSAAPTCIATGCMIPHVTNHDDADITELEAFRVSTNKENEKSGVKVTMLAFVIKASVAALKKFPDFNSCSMASSWCYKKYFHIGFAADTPNGLVVPVIKDADKKGVIQISQEMGELAKKARDGKLGPADMTGACFTISSLGGIGGRYFTPIINAPEVAILGVCKSTMEPKWDGKAFQPRLILPLSLSWDHRVIDGASAARFNAYLVQILGDFRRVLL